MTFPPGTGVAAVLAAAIERSGPPPARPAVLAARSGWCSSGANVPGHRTRISHFHLKELHHARTHYRRDRIHRLCHRQ
jgi:hypothetical protein